MKNSTEGIIAED